MPEYRQVASTSGGRPNPNAKVAVSIIRGGTVVYKQTGEGGTWLSQVPQVGDVVTLESPLGRVIGSEVYDGLPAMDATVCAGSTNFSGENTSGFTVEGSFVTLSPRTNPYGQVTGRSQSGFGEAQVKSLSGTTFGGNFLVPLQLGETVTATESLKTLLAEEATYTYVSENSRPVGACPAPPPRSTRAARRPPWRGSVHEAGSRQPPLAAEVRLEGARRDQPGRHGGRGPVHARRDAPGVRVEQPSPPHTPGGADRPGATSRPRRPAP